MRCRAVAPLILAIALSCSRPSTPDAQERVAPEPAEAPQRRASIPVVLISCDTVRPDHLSVYGYERDTTPNLRAFAEDSIVFNNAFTPVSWTLQAHQSMLTGLHPVNHFGSIDANLSEDITTLAEALRAHGYRTGGFTGFRGWLMPSQGFAQGFDAYEVPDEMVRDIGSTHRNAIDWLQAHSRAATYLFLHNYEAHALLDGDSGPELLHGDPAEYGFTRGIDSTLGNDVSRLGRVRVQRELDKVNRGGASLSENEQALNVAFYDDSIHIVDKHIGKLFGELERLGLYDRALIIVTSDHGEGFGEHGSYGHNEVYDEHLRIPLIVKFPHARFAGRRVDAMVTLMDLMPTILDAIGHEPPKGLDGRSLLPLLESSRATFPERDLYVMRLLWRGLRTTEWKFLQQGGSDQTRLFRIASDPREESNLIREHSDTARGMAENVEAFFAPPPFGWHVLIRQPSSFAADTRLTVSTTGRFNRSWIERPPFWTSDLLDTQDPVRTFEAELRGAQRKHTQLFPEGSDGRLYLTLESETPWTLVASATTHEGASLDLTLDALSHTAKPAGAELDAAVDKPTLYIWHVPRAQETTAPAAMSLEDKAALEALGYVN